MPPDNAKPTDVPPTSASKKPIPAAAERALAEAAARRAERDRTSAQQPPESAGRKGPDPVRYGDWEVKGIATDF
jgi:hypothetical protein